MKNSVAYKFVFIIIVSLGILYLSLQGSFSGRDTFPFIYGGILTVVIGLLLFKKKHYQSPKLVLLALAGLFSAWSVLIGHNKSRHEVVNAIETEALSELQLKKTDHLLFDRQLGGKEIDNPYDFSTKEFTILNFWATWCVPCIKEMPLLNAFYENCEDTEIIGVIHLVNEGQEEKAFKMISDMNIVYPTIEDVDQRIIRDFEVTRWPTTILVDRNGKILDYTIGIMGTSLLIAELEEPCREN